MKRTPIQRRHRQTDILLQILFILVGLLIAFPVIYALSTSFMPNTDILSMNPRLIPRSVSLKNYLTVFTSTNILRQCWNSIVITVTTCVLRLFVAALAAYGFAFYDFRGKKFFFYLTICTMLIPGEATLLTNYQTVSGMHLVNKYAGSIIMFTYSSYEAYIRVHLKPYLGELELKDLSPRTLQQFYNYKSEAEGLSPKTIININLFLHKALAYAVTEGYISSNPAAGVNLPRGKKPQIQILTRDEQARLMQCSYLSHIPPKETISEQWCVQIYTRI